MIKPSRQELANAIRALTMDAVQKANSGHPGMPMGMADIAEVLWNDFLNHNPKNPNWFNRDRFILSNGHGSLLQYATLHLSGYDLSIDDIKSFRQLHSKTPGHPEYGITPGIETTTGPLGQGLGNAVGMAIAEALLAAEFNRENFPIIDHFTYCIVGDGCLMEGISHEVASLAGTLSLGKLIVLYDDNQISIDGEVSTWFTDNTPKRFEAYGWHVQSNIDGHNPKAIHDAIKAAQAEKHKPSILCCKTIIGFGSPNFAGTEKTHGSPLGAKEVQATKENLNWHEADFVIPEAIYAAWDAKIKGRTREADWQKMLSDYENVHPELASKLKLRIPALSASLNGSSTNIKQNDTLKQRFYDYIQTVEQKKEAQATRKSSQQVLEAIIPVLPELIGGSADLSESNATFTKHSTVITAQHFLGNYLHYGVREFGMSAIMNGLALHGGFIPYGGTFLTFLDYARNAVRLSGLMKTQVIYVYSHDSIGLGEDGPTHQPIEHLSMLRATPNVMLWRPCDATETAIAWQMAIEHKGPTSIALTRQVVPEQSRTTKQITDIQKGAYTLYSSSKNKPDVLIIATGSEVALAMAAAEKLKNSHVQVSVVSMPCMEMFQAQEKMYQESVLPKGIPRIAVEAGSSQSWYQWIGFDGMVLGIDRYGESAPGHEVYAFLGLTVDKVIEAVNQLVINHKHVIPA
jgi:transketolase